MKATLALHILAGCLAVAFGYVALYAAKGGTLHRRSGVLFVLTMIVMATLGMLITIVRGISPASNIPAGLLTTALVITAFTTVRPPSAGAQRLDVVAMLVALAVGVTSLVFGVEAVASGGHRHGIPAFPFFMFGVVGLLAGVGDLQVLRSGARRGASRLARHLWRMCFALFIAALSFSVQLPKFIPKPYRIPALLALPIVAVLVTMLYWLWRLRVRRSLHGLVVAGAPSPRIQRTPVGAVRTYDAGQPGG